MLPSCCRSCCDASPIAWRPAGSSCSTCSPLGRRAVVTPVDAADPANSDPDCAASAGRWSLGMPPSGGAIPAASSGSTSSSGGFEARAVASIGPTVEDGAIRMAEIERAAELPFGWTVTVGARRGPARASAAGRPRARHAPSTTARPGAGSSPGRSRRASTRCRSRRADDGACGARRGAGAAADRP